MAITAKPADYFFIGAEACILLFRGAEDHKNLGSYAPIIMTGNGEGRVRYVFQKVSKNILVTHFSIQSETVYSGIWWMNYTVFSQNIAVTKLRKYL